MLSMGMIIIMGTTLFANIAIVKWKIEKGRYSDAGLDVTMLVTLAWVFGGSMTGLIIANVGSAMFSLYLLISPPDLSFLENM